jgi:N-acetylglucosaminyldiphosphoundecaprenol N-acetyl-beta-D-mannosaminyltransferase
MNIINILSHKVPQKAEYLKGNTTFVNPYSYLKIRNNLELLERFDNIYIDGILLVFFLRLFRIVKTKRTSFDMTTMAPKVFNEAITNDESIYFIGAKSDEIENAINNIKFLYPKLNIVGYRNGYFNNENEQNVTINHIIKKSPDIVVVGMGTILQEKFLLKLKNNEFRFNGFTCGGFLHQTAMKQRYFPPIINKLHLRWLYRAIKEPKVVIKRLFIIVFKFPIFFIIDYLRYKNNK